jgi:hypothetical protein
MLTDNSYIHFSAPLIIAIIIVGQKAAPPKAAGNNGDRTPDKVGLKIM